MVGGLFVIAAGEQGNPDDVVDAAPYLAVGAVIGALVGLVVSAGG